MSHMKRNIQTLKLYSIGNVSACFAACIKEIVNINMRGRGAAA